MSTHPSSAFLKHLNIKTMSQEVYTDYEIKEFAAVPDVKHEFMHDWTISF